MVQDARTTPGTDDIRPLNEPVPVQVKTDDGGMPASLMLRGRWLDVASVLDRWRIDDEWWREHPVSRMYYECVVGPGVSVTVYRDLTTAQWFHHRPE